MQYRHYLLDGFGKIILMVLLAWFALFPAAQTQIATAFTSFVSFITITNSPYNDFKKNTNEVWTGAGVGVKGSDE